MRYLDLTFPTPAENLACDEALLDVCEKTGGAEILRVWEPSEYFVVVGYANKVDVEVEREKCHARGIPILRRCSGGGAVVQGPGCLNYSLILNFAGNDSLQTITQANRFIMERQRQLLQTHWGIKTDVEGHTDLAMGGIKFSGNAQRRKKNFLLFHGAFLLQFDLHLITEFLKMPSKQPLYREDRPHEKFLTNFCCPADELKQVLRSGWDALDQLEFVPDLSNLLRERYSRDDWNFKF
jgi:lipoate---protein ligase